MRNYSLPILALFISSLSLSTIAAAAEVVVVERAPHRRHHYVHHADGYYWEGPNAYQRVWIASGRRYEYRPIVVERRPVVVERRPVVVERREVVVHDDHGHRDDR